MSRPALLEMSPARAVWTVSWPMVVIGVLKTLYFLTDSAWIGELGDEALIAAGGGAFAWWMVLLLGEVAGTGAHALVAQQIGAKRDAEVPLTATQALWVALGIGLGAQLLHPALPLYFDWIGYARGSAEHALGQEYLAVSLAGTVAFAAHAALGGVFRGVGDTRTVLWITGTTVVANAVLDPLLIWGMGPIPALGIAGAAWATVLSNALGVVLAAVGLARQAIPVIATAPDATRIRRIVEIGLPVSARGIAFAGIYVVLGRMITQFGTHQMAALGVGHRIESIPYLTSVGFEVGCATLVGQHLGAGDPRGARRATRTALLWCIAFMIPSMVVLYVAAEPLFALFANERATIEAGAVYLRIQTTVFVATAFESVYEGAFTGSARTATSFWIGAIGTSIRIPLAFALAWTIGLGIEGVWIAIALTTALKGAAMALAFERWIGAQTPRERATSC